jgi:hypothetical protein
MDNLIDAGLIRMLEKSANHVWELTENYTGLSQIYHIPPRVSPESLLELNRGGTNFKIQMAVENADL